MGEGGFSLQSVGVIGKGGPSLSVGDACDTNLLFS